MIAASDIGFVVKLCGITNEEDAELALEAGANALGFNLYPKSARYITPERAAEIAQTLRPPFLRVGVFVNATAAEIAHAATKVPLDVVQLHGNHRPARLSRSYRVWQSIIAEDACSSDEYNGAEAYLLDTPSPHFGGSGKTFNWSLAAAFSKRKIIAGGLDATNVADAIRVTSPWGVDACSRLESSPGKKDSRLMREFIQAARAAGLQNAR